MLHSNYDVLKGSCSFSNVMTVCLSLPQVMANVMSLAAPELRLQGLFLVIVWFCLAFR